MFKNNSWPKCWTVNNTIKHKDYKNMKGNPHTESEAKEQKIVLKWDLKTDSVDR